MAKPVLKDLYEEGDPPASPEYQAAEELKTPCCSCKNRATPVDEGRGTGFCLQCTHYEE